MLRCSADHLAYGYLFRGWDLLQALTSDGLAADWPLRPGTRRKRQRPVADAEQANDIFDPSSCWRRLPSDLPAAAGWHIELVGTARRLLTHADPAGWFGAPLIPFGQRLPPVERTTPPILRRAREELASILSATPSVSSSTRRRPQAQRHSGPRNARLQTGTLRADTEAMAATDAKTRSIERRLRLGIRLVLYPLCLGFIALAWTHQRGPTTREQPPPVLWVGATEQGEPVRVVTVDGVLISFRTRIVTHCLNGATWVLSLTMSADAFRQTGNVVSGQQGPNLRTSEQREPVVISSRMRARIDSRPRGTIHSDVTRNPGPRSVQCSSPELHYALHRSTDRQPGNNEMLHPVLDGRRTLTDPRR